MGIPSSWDSNERKKPHIILVSYYFPPDGLIGGARPYRFYKYLKRAGYTCDVITAAAQGTSPPSDVHFTPDVPGDFWEGRRKGPLTARAHLERVLRRIVFPGDVGILWSLKVVRRYRAIVARNRARP